MLIWLALLLVLVIGPALPAGAGVLDASWTAPTTNTDGSALTDLAKYKVYFGTGATACPGVIWLDVPTIAAPAPNTTITTSLTTLIEGTRYTVQVTAVDQAGNESACSISASAVARPNVPPPVFDFTVSGIMPIVSGVIRISAVPKVAASNFTFSILNSAGAVVVSPPIEGAAPYCFGGDDGTTCNPFNTKTLANGSYTLRVVGAQLVGPSLTKDIPFAVSNVSPLLPSAPPTGVILR